MRGSNRDKSERKRRKHEWRWGGGCKEDGSGRARRTGGGRGIDRGRGGKDYTGGDGWTEEVKGQMEEGGGEAGGPGHPRAGGIGSCVGSLKGCT